MMKLSSNGFEFIKLHEGFRSKPYLDSIGVPTIGIGSTRYPDGTSVKITDKPITESQAYDMLQYHLSTIEIYLNSLRLNQNQFDALCSLIYNIGIGNFNRSTLLKKVKVNPNDPTIGVEFKKWNKASGKVLEGLTTRRTNEVKLYFNKNV